MIPLGRCWCCCGCFGWTTFVTTFVVWVDVAGAELAAPVSVDDDDCILLPFLPNTTAVAKSFPPPRDGVFQVSLRMVKMGELNQKKKKMLCLPGTSISSGSSSSSKSDPDETSTSSSSKPNESFFVVYNNWNENLFFRKKYSLCACYKPHHRRRRRTPQTQPTTQQYVYRFLSSKANLVRHSKINNLKPHPLHNLRIFLKKSYSH